MPESPDSIPVSATVVTADRASAVALMPSPTILRMSPVSRGCKSKKSKTTSGLRGAARRRTPGMQPGHPRSAFTAMQALLSPPQRPAWFDSASKTVLDHAGVVMAARGPRELEQATAELLGAELHRVLREEREGMWFSWWFQELTEAAMARIREEVSSRDTGWEPPWRLLHGLTSIGSPALQPIAQTVLGRATKELRGEAAIRRQPAWLGQLADHGHR
jgi:hypothetical protein